MTIDEPLVRTVAGATILQIVASLRDDRSGRQSLDLANALLRSGARAIVAGAGGSLIGDLQAVGGEWIPFSSANLNPWTVRRATGSLEALIGRERVDLVHVRDPDAFRATSNACARRSAWFIASIEGALPPIPVQRLLYRGIERADRVIVESGYAGAKLRETHNLQSKRLIVVPPSIDTTRFDPASVSIQRVVDLRQLWRVQPEELLVVVPGPLEPGQGQLLVIETARILSNGGLRGAVFVLLGEDREGGAFARLIAERAQREGVGPLIRLPGECADRPGAYACADLVLLPATEPQTFNRAVPEAQAMACPMIACAVGAVPELVLAPPRVHDRDRSGWLAPPGDPFALARTIAQVLEVDELTRRDVGRRARRIAEVLLTPESIASATLAIYKQVLENRA